MKVLFYGDSITDAERSRPHDTIIYGLGYGYVRVIADRLMSEKPNEYTIVNRGISGNRVVDLYSRMKSECTNLQPDVINILIGVNDVWHEIDSKNGVEIDRFEQIYRMMIQYFIKQVPNVKIILCEPFVLEGSATKSTEEMPDRWQRFQAVYDYAKVTEKLAKEFNLPFVPLQQKLDEGAKQHGVEHYLRDGVHPAVGGANLLAEEWVKVFKENIK